MTEDEEHERDGGGAIPSSPHLARREETDRVSSNPKLRWGILGPGNIAQRFAADLPLSRTGLLMAVAGRDPAKTRDFAEKYGADRVHSGFSELLADPDVDAVYISTPHPLHAEWAIKAAEAGKHVLCEKPLTVNLAETMSVIEAARRHDVFLMEAYMYRCVPQTTRLIELLRTGAIGQIHQVHASFGYRDIPTAGSRVWEAELAGGGILDVGGYPVSMARLIAGCAVDKPFAEPESLTAVGRLSEGGVDEWAVATLQFASGVTAHVTTSVAQWPDNVVRVVGSEGHLVVSNPWLPGRDGSSSGISVYRLHTDVEHVEVEPTPLYAAEADAVADHLAERQAPQMSWDDTIGTMATLDQWRRAIGLTYPAERAHRSVAAAPRPPLT